MFKRKDKNTTSRRVPVEQQTKAPVFSYYANRSRNEENDTRQMTRSAPKAEWLRYTPSIVAGILILISCIYVSVLSTDPRIVMVRDVTPGKVLNLADYQSKIEKILSASPLNRTKLTFQSDKVKEDIERQYPELGDIAVTVPLLGKRPVVTIAPSPATLILTNPRAALVVDSTGRAIADARGASLGDKTVIVTDESGLSLELGKSVLPKDYVTFITTVSYQLGAKQIAVESMTLPTIANELHVRLINKPYYIKFNLREDARQQTGALLALMTELEQQDVVPAEYIDLRVEERVYYK